MMRVSLVLTFALLCLAASGCASAFLHGARLAGRDTPTSGALAAWDVPACTGVDGRPFSPPSGIRYFLLQGANGTELFEQSADGSGAIIDNQWSGADGTHYYTWVTSSGWEFVIPGAGQPGTRYVYAGTGTTDARPNGSWTAQCPMIPAQ